MKILNLSKVNRGQIVAEFSAEFGNPPWIVIRGLKLLKRETGLWISMPGRKYLSRGKETWENLAQIINPKIFNELNRMAQDEYYNSK